VTTCSPPIDLTIDGATPFDEAVGESLSGLSIDVMQLNIGLTCNLACHHCHVESSPGRDEQMDWPTMQLCLDAARRAGVQTLDLTGGAPEMNPHFRRLVDAAREMDLHVMVRTNLTIMLEPGYTDLPEFFRDRRAHLVASLPCYLEENVDKQRGKHVYTESIEAIRRLNAAGHGREDELPLDLVYNPVGPSLPPGQSELESAYRRQLRDRWGIEFTRLITITNMPIGRFLHDLRRDGRAAAYMQQLREAYNPGTVDGLMCRHQVHVGWDGTLYDCDFNFALALPAEPGGPPHIRHFDPRTFLHRRIATGAHCFGCTAGAGSSCGGTLA